MRRLGREKEGRRIARGDTKSNADVPRGKRIACEMARPDRQRHVRRRGGRRQIFTARSERRPSGRGETARADEKETAGIPVRDEGSELQSARERNGDRCGRPRATETEIARGEATRRAERRRRAKSVLTRKGEGGNCDYRARVTETVEARRITGEDACGASGGAPQIRRGRRRVSREGGIRGRDGRDGRRGEVGAVRSHGSAATGKQTSEPPRGHAYSCAYVRAYVCACVRARVSSPPTGAALLLRRVLLLLREARMKGGDGRGGAAAEGG